MEEIRRISTLCYFFGSFKREIKTFVLLRGFSVAPNTIVTDKEIAVKIRSNSHYRNSPPRGVKSECLSVRAGERLSGKGERFSWENAAGQDAVILALKRSEGSAFALSF